MIELRLDSNDVIVLADAVMREMEGKHAAERNAMIEVRLFMRISRYHVYDNIFNTNDTCHSNINIDSREYFELINTLFVSLIRILCDDSPCLASFYLVLQACLLLCFLTPYSYSNSKCVFWAMK